MDVKTFLRSQWDRVAACCLVILGAAALVLGWFGVSGTGLAAEQNPYLISGGLVGLALIGVGCTLWLSADLQDEWRRLDSLEERLSELVANTTSSSATPNNGRRGSETRRSSPLRAGDKP
jgi:hypothetical protein